MAFRLHFDGVSDKLRIMESSTSVQLAYSILTIRNIFLSIVLYVVLQCLYQVVYYRFFHPLAKFPGPFWAGVTRLWVAYPDLTGQERPKECQELHKRFGGSFFRLQNEFCEETRLTICDEFRARCSHHANHAVRQLQFGAARHISPACK